jgi:hypothetical protein
VRTVQAGWSGSDRAPWEQHPVCLSDAALALDSTWLSTTTPSRHRLRAVHPRSSILRRVRHLGTPHSSGQPGAPRLSHTRAR